MTMPNERTRAIGWGRELLEELANDALLSEAARTSARELRSVYPSSEALEQLLREATQGLPRAWADALVEAGTLFTNLQDAGQGNERTRKGLRWTLRHFPDGRAVRGMESSALIGYWLEADLGSPRGRLDRGAAMAREPYCHPDQHLPETPVGPPDAGLD